MFLGIGKKVGALVEKKSAKESARRLMKKMGGRGMKMPFKLGPEGRCGPLVQLVFKVISLKIRASKNPSKA
jgi:hypothetical protein